MKANGLMKNDARIAKLFRQLRSGSAVARRLGFSAAGANKAIKRLKLRKS